MDLTALKAKRDARIKAKNERIKNELGVAPESGVAETAKVSEPKEIKSDTEKKKVPKNKVKDKRPEEKPM